MSEMVERAALASIKAVPGTGDPLAHLASETIGPMWREVARAALLAALDPEDEALVLRLAKHAAERDGFDEVDWLNRDEPWRMPFIRHAYANLIALRETVQGET